MEIEIEAMREDFRFERRARHSQQDFEFAACLSNFSNLGASVLPYSLSLVGWGWSSLFNLVRRRPSSLLVPLLDLFRTAL